MNCFQMVKRIAGCLPFLAGLLWFVPAPLSAADGLPKVGDKCPDFEMEGTDGTKYKLSDFVGKKAFIIAWYPRAFTPGCTKECQSFKDHGEALRKYSVAYFTASCDSVAKNKEFAKSLGLDYPILSDPEGKVAKSLGIAREGGVPTASRVTFIVGKDGKILAIDDAVKTTSHGQDMAAKLESLGIEKAK
ncbi:MAG: hypothetical protein RLY14_1050 [Planctomycetota bacterium]